MTHPSPPPFLLGWLGPPHRLRMLGSWKDDANAKPERTSQTIYCSILFILEVRDLRTGGEKGTHREPEQPAPSIDSPSWSPAMLTLPSPGSLTCFHFPHSFPLPYYLSGSSRALLFSGSPNCLYWLCGEGRKLD